MAQYLQNIICCSSVHIILDEWFPERDIVGDFYHEMAGEGPPMMDSDPTRTLSPDDYPYFVVLLTDIDGQDWNLNPLRRRAFGPSTQHVSGFVEIWKDKYEQIPFGDSSSSGGLHRGNGGIFLRCSQHPQVAYSIYPGRWTEHGIATWSTAGLQDGNKGGGDVFDHSAATSTPITSNVTSGPGISAAFPPASAQQHGQGSAQASQQASQQQQTQIGTSTAPLGQGGINIGMRPCGKEHGKMKPESAFSKKRDGTWQGTCDKCLNKGYKTIGVD
jgi:hypothetical protein